MNLTGLDWLIVVGMLFIMLSGVWLSKGYMRSVADFLAAGRTAGRYVISMASGMAGLGAVSIVGTMEMNYIAGFSMTWWGFTTAVVVLFVTATGWVVYRFRETRALTLAQFFEMRYSRRFRIFAGFLAFLSGIINFGIFPAVGARFFIYFCGLPWHFNVLGVSVPTFPLIMVILLSISLYFVFSGGQVAVIITDFVQSVFVNFVFVAIVLLLFGMFRWNQIAEGLASAPANASLINPFHTSHVEDFNFWYFLIGVIGIVYSTMSWQGTQGYNSSAKSAHEAKMAAVLSNWRGFPQTIFLLFVPIVAYVVMHHTAFSDTASQVQSVLQHVSNKAIRSQLTVPLVLTKLLPPGFMGAFTAVMLAAFVTTHDTYLHSWGSIVIQDVVMPLRGRPFEPKQHIRYLRLAILGVALFIFFFSLLFQQSEYIFLFFAVTAAIFVGGSGAVIIGGLYWKYGTTAAAWAAMLTGSTISVAGIVLNQIYKDFPINGQWFWGIAMAASSLVYVLVSLIGKREPFNMDALLHRGKYAVEGERKVVASVRSRILETFGFGPEFTRGDKIIYAVTYAWIFFWFFVFVVGTIYNLAHDVPDSTWMSFWKVYTLINVVLAIVVLIWFTVGGVKDLREMAQVLKTMKRDDRDDGFVVDHRSRADALEQEVSA